MYTLACRVAFPCGLAPENASGVVAAVLVFVVSAEFAATAATYGGGMAAAAPAAAAPAAAAPTISINH